ncbi:MAG: bifunctional precorrin-2 dehydrogenase/sirohydrochlorin ferrochelatase [Desulfobacteraceae bacterium]|uniref:precorrin-2 dehydrogenase n=1 Tax=Candidatus Desulfaltia bathyphila TaxID=2841697 RepID=A0A8J6N8N1_9BACT|nr:bifunctional precorrin-2 dehydrogenase/sirohydrochlorin ferrochelatase [Candidatus Desulfaltia bathyphila]MBL7196170.1 bifunctional precorrin-2 dehydrogenase/sirohydrochlorin ferrochelatase [Desulfobacterales bacterium]
MRYYPVNLDVLNRKCLVVGGGSVGTRKVITLLDCGAKVTLVSPDATKKLLELAGNGSITWEKRSYLVSDLDTMFLVIGATNDEELNRQISTDAEKINLLCNIADRPDVCNFILPSIVNRGDLVISISTSGKSPAFAKTLRKELEKQFGVEYAEFLRLMGAIRKKLLSEKHEPGAHKHIFERLISSDLVEMIKNNRKEDINSLLFDILGQGYEFESLMKTDR